MRFASRITGAVLVLMMLIVDVAMAMFERFMNVLVLMPLGDMKIDTYAHQHRRADQLHGRRIAEQQQ